METTDSIQAQVAALEIQRGEVIAQSRVVRDAAFLHSDQTPVLENVNGFKCWPLTLFRFNLLRLVESPLLRPEITPERDELAEFLWICSPQFSQGESTAKAQFFSQFVKRISPPSKPIFKTRKAMKKWQSSCAAALVEETKTLMAVREFVAEAMLDRPGKTGGDSGRDMEYYCDSCSIVAAMAREFGWGEQMILALPLKRAFQYLNEIKEHYARKAGEEPVMWGCVDEISDRQLELLNRRN